MKAYCQEIFGWIHFGRSEVWTGKISWLSISLNKNHGNREQYWETKICKLHQSIHISICEIHI